MRNNEDVHGARQAVWRATRDTASDDLEGFASGSAAALLRASDPLPLYYQIYLVLRQRILSDDVARPLSIPGQNRLSSAFGVCRATANHALDLLAREGLIERIRGVGNRVIYRRPDAHWFTGEDLRTTHPSKMTARILDRQRLALPVEFRTPQIDTADTVVFEQASVWLVADEPVSLERRWVVCDAQAVTPDDEVTAAAFDALIGRQQRKGARFEQTAQVKPATFAAASQLVLNVGEAVLRTRRRCIGPDEQVLEYAEREHHPRRCGLVLN